MLKKIVAAGALVLSVLALNAADAKVYQEGKDYYVKGTVKTQKPEIREFFSFFCGHCFMMQDQFAAVRDHFKGKADFVMNPVYVLGGDMGTASETAYAVAKVRGVDESFARDLFDAIHVQEQDVTGLDFFFNILEKQGIPSDQALQSYNSFVVRGMVSEWDRMVEYAQIEAVPELMVNGLYMVNMDDLNSVEDLNNVIEYLLTL